MPDPALAAAVAALEPLLDLLAAKVVEKLTEGTNVGYQDQTSSPLGRRRHCAAVRRRIAAGLPGACVVGRRQLLSREALAEEMAALKPPPRKVAAPLPNNLPDLRARYGLEPAA